MKRSAWALLYLLITVCIAAAGSKQDNAQQQEAQRTELLNRIETLKISYGRLQERYRETIENRWKQQQDHLRVKEEYKNDIDALRQRQEILYNELSRAKEEALVHENTTREQEDIVNEKIELVDFLKKQVRDKISDATKSVRESYPTGMEKYIAELNEIDGRLMQGTPAAEILRQLFEQRLSRIKEGTAISIGPQMVIQKRGDPVNAEVLRFGNCFAYAVAASGEAFLLSSNAKSRQFRYEWKPVNSIQVKTNLVSGFPIWLSKRRIESTIPVDVLQNSISEQLFEGRKQSIGDHFAEYVKAGGPNIIVLWVVGLIALVIAVERWFILLRRGVKAQAFSKKFLTFLKRGETLQAEKMLKKSPSALARCLRLLWRDRNAPRHAAEKTLKEAFLKELPSLDRRLPFLAALAAAAPLLGLLGTVDGLIVLFRVLNIAGTNDSKILAGGISEALVNTLTGLAIAIPALIVHGYLSERAAFIQNSVQAASAEILNALWPVCAENVPHDGKVVHD
jgi:biopolymer transport protein ExbB